jgi:hypothetical protein
MTVKSLYPTVLPSLNLDFANSKTLDPRITFTRASVGTFVNENGLVATAASGAARFDHDPVTGKCLGLLVEEARTNYLFAFASPSFNWLSAAVYSTYSDSRFGAAQNAHSWTWATATVNHEFGWFDPGSLSTTGNGVQYTVSFWAKANQAFTLQGNIQDERRQTVNFAASLTTSWQYFSFSTPAGIADDGSGTVYFRWLRGVVNVPAGLQIDFAAVNLERGGFPTSYIPTAGSTVTRAADVASMTGTNFSSWYNQSEGSMFVRTNNLKGSSAPHIATLTNVASDEIALYGTTQGTPYAQFYGNTIAGGQQWNLNKAATNPSVAVFAYKANDTSFVVSGGSASTDTSSVLPIPDRFIFCADFNGTGRNSGTIARLTYYPVRLPDAQLQALTAT